MVGFSVEKFAGDPRVPGVTSRSKTSSSEWGPIISRRFRSEADIRWPAAPARSVESDPLRT